jgi:hypothetical protein
MPNFHWTLNTYLTCCCLQIAITVPDIKLPMPNFHSMIDFHFFTCSSYTRMNKNSLQCSSYTKCGIFTLNWRCKNLIRIMICLFLGHIWPRHYHQYLQRLEAECWPLPDMTIQEIYLFLLLSRWVTTTETNSKITGPHFWPLWKHNETRQILPYTEMCIF